jgi:hypothetical protein
MNDLNPIGAPKYRNSSQSKKLGGSDIKWSNFCVQTQLHISLVALQDLMLKIPIAIVKK